MAKVKTLESRVRNGALLAGIPLLLAGFIPYYLDPLVFSWTVARETDQLAPLITPAAGLMILAVGIVPGLPRLARALMMLIFSATAFYFFLECFAGARLGPINAVGRGFLEEPRVIFFLATIVLASACELMVQGKKTSKAFTILALLGWSAFFSNYFVPVGDVVPLLGVIEGLQSGIDLERENLIGFVVFCVFFLVGFLSIVFSLIRLMRSPEGMIRTQWKSSSAAYMLAGAFGWVPLILMVIYSIAADNFDVLAVGTVVCFTLWGLFIGVSSGLGNTILGFTRSSPPIAHGFRPQPVAPAMAGAAPTMIGGAQGQPPATQPAHLATPQAAPRPQPAYQAPQPQPAPQVQPMPAQAAAPLPPAKPQLEPYPGYPGYFICPNGQCRTGVTANAGNCPACGTAI